ncbi:hypothetical protein TURU_082033 [Turdus rufiventris]|nr:hypothetical protein TURU_082033 [Turdus rufiventris]
MAPQHRPDSSRSHGPSKQPLERKEPMGAENPDTGSDKLAQLYRTPDVSEHARQMGFKYACRSDTLVHGIPYNSTGQAIIERANQTLKSKLEVLAKTESFTNTIPPSDQEKCDEIPIAIENAVNRIVWASDIPGRSKRAELLEKELENWKRQEPEGVILQYVDDILILARTRDDCIQFTTIEEVYYSRSDLKDVPLENPDWE